MDDLNIMSLVLVIVGVALLYGIIKLIGGDTSSDLQLSFLLLGIVGFCGAAYSHCKAEKERKNRGNKDN